MKPREPEVHAWKEKKLLDDSDTATIEEVVGRTALWTPIVPKYLIEEAPLTFTH